MNKFEYSQKDIAKFAKENNYTLNNVEKVIRLSLILDDLNTLPMLKNKMVLKGGTAINLIVFDLPRLSVDLDLDFSLDTDKETMLKERETINEALDEYFRLTGYEKTERKNYSMDSFYLSYRTTSGSNDKIKLDINYHNRCHIYEPIIKYISFPFDEKSKKTIKVSYLNPIELFAGKIKALYERGKPRDIYDVHILAKSELLATPEEKAALQKCIVFYSTLGNSSRILDKDISLINKIPMSVFKTELLPMLHNGAFYPREEINKSVITYLQSFDLQESEKEYLSAYYKGVYKPELLFNEETANRLRKHPVALRTLEQILI